MAYFVINEGIVLDVELLPFPFLNAIIVRRQIMIYRSKVSVMTFSFASTCIHTLSFSIFGEGSVSVDLLHRFSSSRRSCWSSSREGFSFVCSILQQDCHYLHPILDNIYLLNMANVYLAKATYLEMLKNMHNNILFKAYNSSDYGRELYNHLILRLFACSWFRMAKCFQ